MQQYKEIKKLTINSLIILHAVKDNNTITKLVRVSNLTICGVRGVLKGLIDLELIYYSKYKREKIINYTFKAVSLYKNLDIFLNDILKKEVKEVKENKPISINELGIKQM